MEDILQKILETLKENKKEKMCLTIDEASEISGIGKSKLYELINKENTDFPYFKNGKKYMVYRIQLMDWVGKIVAEHREI